MSNLLHIDFYPGLQASLINDRGLQVVHEIAITCTCRITDTYAGLKEDGKQRRAGWSCPRCGDSGWLYRDPVLLTGMVTGIRQQKNILDIGVYKPGDMLLSPLPTSGSSCGDTSFSRKIGMSDKITATWPQVIDDGIVIIRGAASTGENTNLKNSLAIDEDRLWYEPASAIWCEDDQGNTYTEGSDFTLGPGRIIKWVGNQPALKQAYTFKYNGYFEWIVFANPQERIDRNGDDLGQAVMLRKKHVVSVNSEPTGSDSDKTSFRSKVSC